jgi:sterol desaturase/sphingolipid hydroxylase (fatty acid hydroxylase superfamily)
MSSFLVPFAILTAVFASVASLERIPALQYTPTGLRRPWLATDAAWYLVAALAAGLSTFVFRPVLSRLALPGSTEVVASLPGWLGLVVAVVIFDGAFFALHALLHRSGVLWKFHKVHHSSRHLDVWATTRTHAFEQFVRNVPAQLVLFALGFPAVTVASAVLVVAGFGALNHSNLRLPFRAIEWLFVTPRLHRLHHVPGTSLKNYATVLTVWDRAVGSLVRADTPRSAQLGVPGEVTTYPQRFGDAFREPARQIAADHRARPRWDGVHPDRADERRDRAA